MINADRLIVSLLLYPGQRAAIGVFSSALYRKTRGLPGISRLVVDVDVFRWIHARTGWRADTRAQFFRLRLAECRIDGHIDDRIALHSHSFVGLGNVVPRYGGPGCLLDWLAAQIRNGVARHQRAVFSRRFMA